jgi:hypothetical protein
MSWRGRVSSISGPTSGERAGIPDNGFYYTHLTPFIYPSDLLYLYSSCAYPMAPFIEVFGGSELFDSHNSSLTGRQWNRR